MITISQLISRTILLFLVSHHICHKKNAKSKSDGADKAANVQTTTSSIQLSQHPPTTRVNFEHTQIENEDEIVDVEN